MSTKTKKKLCWNCEGDVLVTATQCPFCGVSLEVAAMDNQKENQKSKDPFAPPYKLVTNSSIPSSPYSPATAPQEKKSEESEEETPSSHNYPSDPKNIVLSLAFLLIGAAFAIFGLVLWLFADQTGHLNLRWNAHYWFVYVLISAPLLYLGWKAAQRENDEEKE